MKNTRRTSYSVEGGFCLELQRGQVGVNNSRKKNIYNKAGWWRAKKNSPTKGSGRQKAL